MDSNLSLLEIAGEDDSLLLQVPKDDPSSLFACSPLQCLRSLPPQTEGRGGAVPPENTRSSPKDDVSKENINGNKTEAPKLSVEPQQMKRKKKGGGYSLRKSLAWDRAFFTEEGVLDPLELSMISGIGNHSRTNTELTVIHEEEPETLVDKTNTISASPGLRAFEENLSKEMPDSTSIELKKIGACLSPKPDALTKDTRGPPSLAKRKVLAVNDINRSRSKRNVCARPAALSSNDTLKVPSKESKVARLPVLKSNAPVIPSTARTGALNTSPSNRNQDAHPATNVQKNAGVKAVSKIPESVLSNAKFDLADKRSVTRTFSRQAGKNIDNSVSQMHPPSRLQHQQANVANKGSCHPPQAVCIAGEKNQQSQFQATKPSGLRMPSPSLGFFSQPKAFGSHSLQQKSSKSCKPAERNISKSRKAGANSVDETRPVHSTRKSSDIVKDAANKCTLKPSLLEVSLQVEPNQNPKVVQCGSLGFEEQSKQEKDKKSLEYAGRNSEEQAEPYKSESVSNMADMEFQIDNEKLLSQGDTHKQSEKEADHHSEDKLYMSMSNKDMFVFQGSQSIEHCSMQRIPIRKDNLSNVVNNAMTCDEDEQIKPFTCNIQTSGASLGLQGKQDSSSSDSHSVLVKNYNCVKIVNVDPGLGDLLGWSLEGIAVKKIEQAKEGAGEFDKHGGYAQVNFLDGNLSVDCNDTNVNISVAVDQRDMEENWGEKLETPIPSIGGDTLLETDNESKIISCLIHKTTLSSQESSELSLPDINNACRSESNIAEMEDCQHPEDDQLGSIHRRPVDDRYDQLIDSEMMNDRAQANSLELHSMCEDSLNVSATACSAEVSTLSISQAVYQNDMDENCVEQSETPNPNTVGVNHLKADHQSKINTFPVHVTTLSSQGSPEKPLQDVNGACRSESEIVELEDCQHPEDGWSGFSLELDRMCEDSITVSTTAYRTEVSNASPESEHFYENNAEYPHYTSQTCQLVQTNCSSRGIDLSLNNWCTISKLHSGEDSSSSDTSMHFDSLSVQSDVQGTSELETGLLISSETTEILCENESSVANQCRLPDKSECFVVSADISSVSEVRTASVAESSSGLFQNKLLVETAREFDYPNRVIEKLHVENAHVQSSDENLVAYKFYNNPHTSVANDHVSLVVDNVNEQSHLLELQKPSLVIAVDSHHVNNSLHLNGDLLPANNACSEKIKKESLSDGALEPSSDYIYLSGNNTSDHHIQATSETVDRCPDVNEKAELLQMDGAEKGSAEMLPLVEVEFNYNGIAADPVSSIRESEDQMVEVVDRKPDEYCSLSESPELPVADNLMSNGKSPPCDELGSMKSKSLPEEAEASIYEKDEISNTEMQRRIKTDDYFAEDSSKIVHLNKSEIKSKQDVPTVKPPPNAAPFSDEWLAAMEAAGEEILTMKGGAVQNSPPDKPHHEPGPWSPVRRKNQAIGPHDCTKYTNNPHPTSS